MKRYILVLTALLLTLLCACSMGGHGRTPEPNVGETVKDSVQTQEKSSGARAEDTRESLYADVSATAWYADYVAFVTDHGLMNGTGEGQFSPDAAFTRAQMATVLYRLAGQPPVEGRDSFSDTDPNEWYAAAILWAEQSGVVNGLEPGRFAPNDTVLQEQLITMLWRVEGQPDAPVAPDANVYAGVAVGWAREQGIIPEPNEGYTFTPWHRTMRSQVAALLTGYLKYREAHAAEQGGGRLTLTVGGTRMAVEWADNASVEALRELLGRTGPLTLDMSDYGGFEKGARLPESLPTEDEQTDVDFGDVILYQGRQFVLYYDKNTWSLTRLGKVTGMSRDELRILLGDGNVTATLALE